MPGKSAVVGSGGSLLLGMFAGPCCVPGRAGQQVNSLAAEPRPVESVAETCAPLPSPPLPSPPLPFCSAQAKWLSAVAVDAEA